MKTLEEILGRARPTSQPDEKIIESSDVAELNMILGRVNCPVSTLRKDGILYWVRGVNDVYSQNVTD